MKRLALLLIPILAGVMPLAAQNTSAEAEKLRIQAEERARKEVEQRDWETRLFPIRYVNPVELQTALGLFRAEMRYSGDGLRTLSVRAPKEIMPAIEEAIKRLDVLTPRKEAEITIQVVLASEQDGAVPQALQPVTKQLRNVLSYRGYQLLDTQVTRVSSSSSRTNTSLSGVLPALQPLTSGVTYSLDLRSQADIRDGKESVLCGLIFRLSVQTLPPTNLVISTDVEIPRGQQVVVGKATYNDKAFILVMSAKFD